MTEPAPDGYAGDMPETRPRGTNARGVAIYREKVFRARISRGLSRAALAREIGASEATIARVETGERRPSPAMLVKLAEALGLGIEDLEAKP